MKFSQSGFTLLEIMIVLTIMGLVAPYIAPDYILKLEERRSDVVIAETAAIYSAAANFRNVNGAWPGGAACATAINDLSVNSFLSGVDATNAFNNGVVTSCTANEFTIIQDSHIDVGSYIAAGLPATQVTNAATGELTSIFPLPGAEPALASLLDLAGTRVMTGNLQMGGNDITNARRVTATTDMRAPQFVDSDNTTYMVNPAGTSRVSRLDADSQIRTPIMYDSDNTSYYVNPAGRSQLNTLDVDSIRDRNDTTYMIDPDGTSRVNYVDGEYIRLRSDFVAGAACTDESIGTTSTGELMSCVSGVWTKPGGSGFGNVYNRTSSRSIGVNYTNTSGGPLFLSVTGTKSGNLNQTYLYGYIDGALVARMTTADANYSAGWLRSRQTLSMVVPAGSVYQVARSHSNTTVQSWYETY